MRYPWQHIPDPIRTALLQCSSGRAHLLNTAVGVLEAANAASARIKDTANAASARIKDTANADVARTKDTANADVASAASTQEHPAKNDNLSPQTLLRLGSELLQASWEEQPFESQTTAHLLALDKAAPFLPDPIRITARQMLNALRPPTQDSQQTLERLTRQNDVDGLVQFTQRSMEHDPGNGFWYGLSLFLGMRHGRFSWLESLLAKAPMPEALRQGFQADLALLHGQWDQAAAGYETAYTTLPLDLWRERQAQALARSGHKDTALRLLDDLVARRPWHVQRLLQRDGLLHGLDDPGALPEGPGVVLLYTWNGGQKIHRTLEGLANSHLPPFNGTAQIVLIDNGSTDGETLASMTAWEEKLGGRLRLITLPCNVGAPPARNWLLTQPEARAADWIVFLDDDLIVPQDWLGHFGNIMRHAPNHDVYGCQILRDDIPQLIQATDMHLLPASTNVGPGGWLPEVPVHMQATYHGQNEPDFGQFAFARPCVHVSGCCHLFRRAAFDRFGGFDLRFAPTQVDDFEHDIRMAVQGSMPLYHGYLRVRHYHATGKSTAQDLGKAMNAHANHLKLQGLYPPKQFELLRRQCAGVLLQNVLTRQRHIQKDGDAPKATAHTQHLPMTDRPIKVLMVIVHYGDPALAQGLARSLDEASNLVTQGLDRSVDNVANLSASTPSTVPTPGVTRVFDNAAPRPYAGAWHRAAVNGYWTGALRTCLCLAREQGYSHLWFLNNDIVFVTPPPSVAQVEARLALLGKNMGHPVGVWSPAVVRNPYHPQMCHQPGKQACRVNVVDGIAPVYALECVEAVGGLDADDNPYGYGVDMWLSLRAAKTGWPVVVDHHWVIRHKYHTTAKTLDGFMQRAALAEEAYMQARLGPQWREHLETLKI